MVATKSSHRRIHRLQPRRQLRDIAFRQPSFVLYRAGHRRLEQAGTEERADCGREVAAVGDGDFQHGDVGSAPQLLLS